MMTLVPTGPLTWILPVSGFTVGACGARIATAAGAAGSGAALPPAASVTARVIANSAANAGPPTRPIFFHGSARGAMGAGSGGGVGDSAPSKPSRDGGGTYGAAAPTETERSDCARSGLRNGAVGF